MLIFIILTFRLLLFVSDLQRLKRTLKKPHRYKTTLSEEQVKSKKPKPFNKEKTKKKVTTTLQDIRNTINNENVYLSRIPNCNKNSTCTVTKAGDTYDQTCQHTFTSNTQTEKSCDQENDRYTRIPYCVIPLTEKNVYNNTEQHTTDNFVQNCQRQTVDDLYSSNVNNATSIPSQQKCSIYENNFHRVLTDEPNTNIMENNITHKKVLETVTQPIIHLNGNLALENEMQQLHNLQPRHQQSFTNVCQYKPIDRIIESHTNIGKYSTNCSTSNNITKSNIKSIRK